MRCIVHMFLVKKLELDIFKSREDMCILVLFRVGGDGRFVYLHMEEITWSIHGVYLIWHYPPSLIGRRENAKIVLF